LRKKTGKDLRSQSSRYL